MNPFFWRKIWLKNQKNSQSGLTLLQLLIIIILAGIIAYFMLPRLKERNTQLILGVANQNLMLFARKNNLTPLECIPNDADRDGWVSCTVENEQKELMTIQCGYDQRHQSCRFLPNSDQQP